MNSHLACPYCYHRINGRRLWFQCAGRGSPGKGGCSPAVDESRVQQTGFAEEIRPAFPPPAQLLRVGRSRQAACPRCGGVTGIRACPVCHTPLSANFGGSSSPLIAMVGAAGTGKTVYLTVLAHALRTSLRRRFNADVRLTGDPQGGFRSPLQWLENNVDQMYKHQELFPQTNPAVRGRREPLVFEWRWEQKLARLLARYRTSFLSFYDTAGEDLNSQQTAHDLAYLGAADALILLLDPFMLPQARQRIYLPAAAIKSTEATIDVVARITEKLRTSHRVNPTKKIEIPVAVAFAKIDAFFGLLGSDHPLVRTPAAGGAYDENLGQATHEQIRALLHDWGADDVDVHLRYNYAHFRYFALSSLGIPPDYESLTITGGVHPHRVEEPLVWLLSLFGVVPRQRET
jgi:hypothetical protein